jgi:hypothetical protein
VSFVVKRCHGITKKGGHTYKTTTTLSNTNNWNWVHSYGSQTSCKLVQTLFNFHIEVIPNYKITILNLWTLMDHHTLDLLSSKLWWSTFVTIQTIDLNNFFNISHLLNPFDSQNEPEIEKVQTSKHYNSLTKHLLIFKFLEWSPNE